MQNVFLERHRRLRRPCQSQGWGLMFKLTLNPTFIPSALSCNDLENLFNSLNNLEKSILQFVREQIENLDFAGWDAGGISLDTAALSPDDLELMGLRNALHEVAILAERRMAALPEDIGLDEELACIADIMRPGDAIAERMLLLVPATPEAVDAKLRAGIWTSGDYFRTYLRPAC